jgi:thioredoxin-related protein
MLAELSTFWQALPLSLTSSNIAISFNGNLMDGKMRYLLLVLMIVSLMPQACSRHRETATAPAAGLRWYDSVEEARQAAEVQGDLVLMSFEASWCPWSQLLHDSLYVDSTVIDSLRDFRCVRIDVDSDSLLKQEMGIDLYPTIVITDAYGGELGRITGYEEPPVFLSLLSPIRHRVDRVSHMFATEGMSRNDPEFLLSFGNLLFEMGVYDAALMRYEWAGDLDPDNAMGIREEAQYAMGECYMLSDRDRSAARTFRSFATSFPESERTEEALLLAGLCYERAGYNQAARDVYRAYMTLYEDGRYTGYVAAKLEKRK